MRSIIPSSDFSHRLVHRCRASRLGVLLLLAAFVTGTTDAAEPPATDDSTTATQSVESGPQPGARIQQFFVRAVTGPHRNRSVCYVCRYGDRPVIMVFIQQVDPELPALLTTIDAIVDEHRADGLRSFGVLITDESSTVVPILQTMAFDEKIRTPLTAATTAVAGPACHNLSSEAATTVVLYRHQQAIRSFAFRSREITSESINQVRDGIDTLLTTSNRIPSDDNESGSCFDESVTQRWTDIAPGI